MSHFKYFETRLAAGVVAITLALALAIALVTSVSANEEQFVTELEQSGVNFIYSEGQVTLIKTAETTEAVEAIVAKQPDSVKLTIVIYSDTGNRKPGWKLSDEEETVADE